MRWSSDENYQNFLYINVATTYTFKKPLQKFNAIGFEQFNVIGCEKSGTVVIQGCLLALLESFVLENCKFQRS